MLGCILEAGAILLIIVPIFIPTVLALGIDLVHFGVVVVVNAMIGLITPPYGLCCSSSPVSPSSRWRGS